MVLGDALEASSHGVCRFAAHVRIHLVEEQDRNGVLVGKGGFQGEHDAGELAARSDGTKGTRGFSWVWRK